MLNDEGGDSGTSAFEAGDQVAFEGGSISRKTILIF